MMTQGRFLVYRRLREFGFPPRTAWAARSTLHRFMSADDRIDLNSVFLLDETSPWPLVMARSEHGHMMLLPTRSAL